MTDPTPHPTPDPDPDPGDTLDWDRERDGLMVDAATSPEDEPVTVPYVPDGV